MSDIFISYSREDRALAEAIVKVVHQGGWSVWWDRALLPGETFDRSIEEALNSARCVIVLWSRHSVRSDWVKDEAADAAERQILVPVLIEGIAPPLGFRRIQTANLSDWDGVSSHPELDQLLNAVSEKIGTPPVAPKPGPRIEVAKSKATAGGVGGGESNAEWSAKLVSKNIHDRSLQVYLTHGSHIVEYHWGAWKDYVKVDGEVVSQGFGFDENYSFQITDGSLRYAAKVECKTGLLSQKKFRLIIDDRVLYAEG